MRVKTYAYGKSLQVDVTRDGQTYSDIHFYIRRWPHRTLAARLERKTIRLVARKERELAREARAQAEANRLNERLG
jgi:uncharacterized iron-regulated protein